MMLPAEYLLSKIMSKYLNESITSILKYFDKQSVESGAMKEDYFSFIF